MRAVGVRELKNRLSEYLRRVRRGEEIMITDRGEIIAELRKPGRVAEDTPYPALLQHARKGKARLGAENRPDLYPSLEPALPKGKVAELLDQERGEH